MLSTFPANFFRVHADFLNPNILLAGKFLQAPAKYLSYLESSQAWILKVYGPFALIQKEIESSQLLNVIPMEKELENKSAERTIKSLKSRAFLRRYNLSCLSFIERPLLLSFRIITFKMQCFHAWQIELLMQFHFIWFHFNCNFCSPTVLQGQVHNI